MQCMVPCKSRNEKDHLHFCFYFLVLVLPQFLTQLEDFSVCLGDLGSESSHQIRHHPECEQYHLHAVYQMLLELIHSGHHLLLVSSDCQHSLVGCCWRPPPCSPCRGRGGRGPGRAAAAGPSPGWRSAGSGSRASRAAGCRGSASAGAAHAPRTGTGTPASAAAAEVCSNRSIMYLHWFIVRAFRSFTTAILSPRYTRAIPPVGIGKLRSVVGY